MSNGITISIEGSEANEALAELLAIDGIAGMARPAHSGPVYRDAGVLSAVAEIVSISGGVAAMAGQILAWREKWRKQRETKRLNVVIEDAKGNRLALDDATPDQIAAALQTLAG